ncbi:MAG TPA: protealysin inhibitor emfourin [Candidatus Limnocylindrales bacterium]|jgi:hypothetical protein
MKVSITQGGTIVPVVTTIEVDSDVLAAKDAEALRKLVERAAIGKQPAPAGSSHPAQPDRGGYRITIDDESQRASVSLPDADLRPETRELVDWVSAHPQATRRTSPLGR